MPDQRQFTKEDCLRLLDAYGDDIRSLPEATQADAARIATSRFTEEEWKAWKATKGFRFSEAWDEWIGAPAGYIIIVNVAAAHLPQSYDTLLLYNIPDPNPVPPSDEDDNKAYTDSESRRIIGYSRTKRRGLVTILNPEIPEGCRYLGHVYSDEDTEVHTPPSEIL